MYKLRFPSEEEKIYMIDIFKKYLEYVNLKRSKKIQFPTSYNILTILPFYNETTTNYFMNMEIINKTGKNGINWMISKKELNKWLKENNIIKPNFSKAKLIK